MKKRNSLIELFRFLFAMNVVVGHGFFPIETSHFRTERVSVEFFFMLSGFLFCGFLKKIADMKPLQAIKITLIAKLKPLAVPIIIGLASNAVLNVISDYNPKIEIFRYLWYIPAMMAVLVLYAALRTIIKSDRIFWCTVGCLFVLAALMRFSGNEKLFFFDYIRSTSAVSLGMLLAKIPRPVFKRRIIPWLILIPTVTAVFPILYNNLAKDVGGILTAENIGYEALLNFVLYPIIIYISFGIEFSFAPLNYLGSLTFGIYAYQCPGRLLGYIGMPSPWIPFLFVFAAAIVDDLIKRMIRKKQKVSFLNQKADNQDALNASQDK